MTTILNKLTKLSANTQLFLPSNAALRFLLVVLLCIGIFFRFYNLEGKVYWQDETFTSLRIAGYTDKELRKNLFNGEVIGIEQLYQYQQPNAEKGLFDTVKALATEEPQNPPLYFAIARSWVQIFGFSPTTIRSLSAVLSVLVLPCVYWLCWELFNTPIVSVFATALVAVSPFHIAYAQEARGYALWTVIILLSSILMLRAMQQKTIASWGIYALSLTAGFYTFPLTVFVAIAHGLYVKVTEKLKVTRTVLSYLLATLTSLLAFSPWLAIFIIRYERVKATTGWTEKPVPLFDLVYTWGVRLSGVFTRREGLPELLISLIVVAIAIGVGYSIYFVTRRDHRKPGLLILTLMAANFLPFALVDLVLGGTRSTVFRYFIPCILAIQIAVAFVLSTQFFATILRRKILKIVTVVLLSVGIISSWIVVESPTLNWRSTDYDVTVIAEIVNQAKRPLLVSTSRESNQSKIFSAIYLLSKQTKFQLVTEPNVPKIPSGFSDVFLFNPSDEMRSQLEKQQDFTIKPVTASQNLGLWKLTRSNT